MAKRRETVYRWSADEELKRERYERQVAQKQAIVNRLRADGERYRLRVTMAPFSELNPLEFIEVDGVRVPERYVAEVFTDTGWLYRVHVRATADGEVETLDYHASQVEGVEPDDAGEPFKSWGREALTQLLMEQGGEDMPLSPRPQRPGRTRVSDEHLREVVRLYDGEGLSLRDVAMRMTGSKNGATAKRWLEMAEERGLR